MFIWSLIYCILGSHPVCRCLSVDLSKVSAMLSWHVPLDMPQMRSFLGLANCFRKFVKGYAPMTIPLC